LAAPLKAAIAGSVVSLGALHPDTCAPWALQDVWRGGKLIFSDSPEEPAAPGILYRDGTLLSTTHGEANRVFVYHTNGGATGRLRFSVLLTNRGSRAGRLTVVRHGTAGPSQDYLNTGKLAFERWLRSSAETPVPVAAGATVRLDTSFDAILAKHADLVHGIWDYTFDGPHEIAICALAEGGDPIANCAHLPVLAKDIHQRGTFPHADKRFAGRTVLPGAFVMGGNTPQDPNAQGVDRTDGSTVSLAGNYGVLYRMRLDPGGSESPNVALLIQPLGGAWGGAAMTTAGSGPGTILLLPDATAAVESAAHAVVAGTFTLPGRQRIQVEWLPTGGSSFPVRLIAVPYR
jgi:hypothetical protein